jgi:hypothetical protein
VGHNEPVGDGADVEDDVCVEDVEAELDALSPVLAPLAATVEEANADCVLLVDCVPEGDDVVLLNGRTGVELALEIPISVANGYPWKISLALSS